MRADPEGTPVPMMITLGTDAKALAELGIPCYGFAPMRLEPEMPFLSLFHGHDERVPVSALAFGLPVLADVVADTRPADEAASALTEWRTRLPIRPFAHARLYSRRISPQATDSKYAHDHADARRR